MNEIARNDTPKPDIAKLILHVTARDARDMDEVLALEDEREKRLTATELSCPITYSS